MCEWKDLARYYKAKRGQRLQGFIYRQCLILVRLNRCLRSVGSQKGLFVHCYDGVLILRFDRQNRCHSTTNERHAKWRKDIVHQQLSLSLSKFLIAREGDGYVKAQQSCILLYYADDYMFRPLWAIFRSQKCI